MAKRALKAEDVQPSYEGWSEVELWLRISIIRERGSKRDQRDIPMIEDAIAKLVAGRSKKNRVAEVNKELRKRGENSQLRRGAGYYYFDGDATSWYSSSVYVSHSDAFTVAEWMTEFEQLKNSPFNR